jgi:hypothetical protein
MSGVRAPVNPEGTMTDTSVKATTALATPTTSFTVSPDDAAQALRMGWIVAELRGRLDPKCRYKSLVGHTHPPPTLLLEAANERNAVEGQIEATKILSTLGGLDLTKIDIKTLSSRDEWGPVTTGGATVQTPDMLRFLVCRLIYSRDPKQYAKLDATLTTKPIATGESTDQDEWWSKVQWFLWAWDEALQDQLAAGNFGTASSYELGRGLSECYWAAMNVTSSEQLQHRWSFYLGEGRVQTLRELSLRLAPVFNPYTAPAVIASVASWGEVVQSETITVDIDHLGIMEGQARIWRDLLVTGRDPRTLVKPSTLEAVARDPRPIIKAFRWELLTAAVLAVVLAVSLTYYSSQSRAVLAALATVGISASAIVSWIKSRAQSVAVRVGSAVDQSVVNEAVDKAAPLLPPTTLRHRIRHPSDHPS